MVEVVGKSLALICLQAEIGGLGEYFWGGGGGGMLRDGGARC